MKESSDNIGETDKSPLVRDVTHSSGNLSWYHSPKKRLIIALVVIGGI